MVPDRLCCISELCFIRPPAALSLVLSLYLIHTHTHTLTHITLYHFPSSDARGVKGKYMLSVTVDIIPRS